MGTLINVKCVRKQIVTPTLHSDADFKFFDDLEGKWL